MSVNPNHYLEPCRKVGIGNLLVLFLSDPRPDKCETLCKQSQELVMEFEMKATLGKFDIGNSMLVYFSLPK